MRPIRYAILALALSCASVPALAAAPCGGDFGAWLQGVKQEAAAQGISQRAIAAGLAGVTPDPGCISLDRGQHVFSQSFEQFSGRMVPPRAWTRDAPDAAIRLGVQPHRAAVRRARRRDRRHLGARDRLRRQLGKIPDHPLAGDARLRLPPPGQVSRRTDRRAEHRRPRRHGASRHARRLGGRDRPDPVPALVLSEIRRRFRRQRPPAISSTACPTCSPRRRTISRATAGSAASRGAKAPPISRCCCSGTSRRSTPRPSPISPSSLRAADSSAASCGEMP